VDRDAPRVGRRAGLRERNAAVETPAGRGAGVVVVVEVVEPEIADV